MRHATPACAEFEPDLSALLDGELGAAREDAVEGHLTRCKPCRRLYGALGGVSSALRRWDAEETHAVSSPAFRKRVLDRVHAEPGANSRLPRAPEPTPLVRVPIAPWHRAAAAAVLLVGAGLATALVVPALRGTDLVTFGTEATVADARLAELVERASASPNLDVPQTTAWGASDGRFDPSARWDAIVSEPRRLAVASQDDSSGLQARELERHGEFRVFPDAVLDYQQYSQGKRFLWMEEQLRARPDLSGAAAAADATTLESSPLRTFLDRVTVSAKGGRSHGHVQVWPIRLSGSASGASVGGGSTLLAQEALRAGVLRARQTASRSAAQGVQIENTDAERSILILAGDVLKGGRQDVVAAADTLIAPGGLVTIASRPSGKRRASRGSTYTPSPGIAPVHLRQMLVVGNATAEAWDNAVKGTVAGLASVGNGKGRGSLHSVFVNNELRRDVDRQARHFAERLDHDDVIGFAVAAGSEVLGIELFAQHETFAAALPRLLGSYLLEARLRTVGGSIPERASIVAMLDDARSSPSVDSSSGRGVLASFTSVESGVHGFALMDGASAMHVSVFPPRVSTTNAGAGLGRTGAESGVDGLGGEPGAEPGAGKGSSEPKGAGFEGR